MNSKTQISILLNVVLVIVILGYIGVRAYKSVFGAKAPRTICVSVSPDGKWQCVVTNVNPKPDQCTATFSIEPVAGLPLSGTQYVVYSDSVNVSPSFKWSANKLVVVDSGRTVVAEFDEHHQQWTEVATK